MKLACSPAVECPRRSATSLAHPTCEVYASVLVQAAAVASAAQQWQQQQQQQAVSEPQPGCLATELSPYRPAEEPLPSRVYTQHECKTFMHLLLSRMVRPRITAVPLCCLHACIYLPSAHPSMRMQIPQRQAPCCTAPTTDGDSTTRIDLL
jgi:hypothetical protein